VTVVETPPQPQPSQDELEALIEEARCRTRRRRRIVATVGLAVIGASAGVAVVLLSRGGHSTEPAVPQGFHLVHARGPVSHATITEYPPLRQRLVDVATGRERPAPLVLEVWWDAKSGFDRVVGRVAGRVGFDVVGQTCEGPSRLPRRFCLPPPPFDLPKMHYRLPVDPAAVRVVGKGTYRGHPVIWLEGLVNGRRPSPRSAGYDWVALDVVTHRPVAKREFAHGRKFYEESYSVLGDLPGKDVTFVVPDQGAARHSFPPFPSVPSHFRRTDLRRARSALGIVPLWLGPRFAGHTLKSVAIGSEDAVAPNGSGLLRRARFVRFDYGALSFREFGRVRPFGFVNGPPRGRIVIDGDIVQLSRDRLVVIAQFPGRALPIKRSAALAFARALRPVPSG
jgi:hypothetical protein